MRRQRDLLILFPQFLYQVCAFVLIHTTLNNGFDRDSPSDDTNIVHFAFYLHVIHKS